MKQYCRSQDSATLSSSRTSSRLGLLTNLFALVLLSWATTNVAYAQTFKVLSSLGYPWSSLVQGADGNLYGATDDSIFEISPAGTPTILQNVDGSPWGVILASDGNFYGTTYTGGPSGGGTVFRLTPTGVVTTLHNFEGPEGAQPYDGVLVQSADGDLYGTTYFGGAFGYGVAYKITLSGTYTKLHDFNGSGVNPISALIQATDGNFYGVTADGFYGSIFKMTPSGTVTTLHTFDSSDGYWPYFGLVQAVSGKLYGTTTVGGANGYGTVYEITTAGEFTVLHSFNGSDGENPFCTLIQATNGNLYGTTSAGGPYDGGTVFEITPAGTLTTLHNFCPQGNCSDGYYPRAGLLQATNGILYGTAFNNGDVFSLSVGLAPFVEPLPAVAPEGTPISILGTNLTGATSVSFNGTPALFTVLSATQVSTTVPAGATTGKIEVVTPTATLYTNVAPFRVLPEITAFSPSSGPLGTTLVIAGTGLLKTSRVTFYNNVPAASFAVNSDTQVTVTVPAGATTGPIQVTTAGGTVTSSAIFTVN